MPNHVYLTTITQPGSTPQTVVCATYADGERWISRWLSNNGLSDLPRSEDVRRNWMWGNAGKYNYSVEQRDVLQVEI